MTAIAGVIHEGRAWIGGDSAGVADYSIELRKDPKVFAIGDFVIGYTSSFRMGQLIRYHLDPPSAPVDVARHAYMVREFVPAMRKVFKDHGYLRTKDGREEAGTFLVGWRASLFVIHDDLQVGECLAPYAACGCGRDLVLGSLHTTQALPMSPEDRIAAALCAAEAHSAGVREPFTVLSTVRGNG